jgi:tRNA(Arg) A34 adenosine deaminase TadA
MRLAIAKAREGVLAGQTPFGACIVRDGEVLSLCHNEVWASTDSTAHAEILAIREACRVAGQVDLSGGVIYSSCEPCPMCFSACHWARLDKIYFGTAIQDARQLGFNEMPISNQKMKELGVSKIEIESGLLRSEAEALFQLWAENALRVY